MSTETKVTKKRKSGDHVVPPTKKVKVATATTRTTRSADAPPPPPPAEAPAPLKSALKKKKDTTKKEAATKKVEEKPVQAKKEKKTAAAVAAKDIISDDEEAGTALTTAQTDAIFAGFTDSEDEEAAEADTINIDTDAIEIAKLPKAPKPKATSTSTTTSSADPESSPGVVYISRIPHGFYEPQMTAYFSQFGPITALHLARNRKSGKSQHFAFIQFESASVADIVARTMDKYLLFGHLLQARTIPMDQVKEGLFGKGGVKKGGKVRPRNRIEGGLLKRGAERERWGKRVGKEEKRRAAKGRMLEALGYEFDMPGVKGVEGVPVQQQEVVEEGKGVVDPTEVIVDEVEEKKIEEVIEEGKKGGKSKEKRKAKGGVDDVEVAAVAPKKKKAKKAKVAV